MKKPKLYYKLYSLLRFLYDAVDNFERQYKYSLGKETLDLTWKCLDLTLEACADKKKREEKLKNLSSVFDKLKVRIRMCQEVGQLSEGQISHIHTYYLMETGKMIGGWIKSIK